jgi:hypothetical protein
VTTTDVSDAVGCVTGRGTVKMEQMKKTVQIVSFFVNFV